MKFLMSGKQKQETEQQGDVWVTVDATEGPWGRVGYPCEVGGAGLQEGKESLS